MFQKFTGLFYGWRMIAAACALRVLGAGLHSFGFTVFFLPLSQDLNLNRTSTSLAFSLARAEGAIEGPIVGHLLDRYGPKPIMLAAVLLMGTGYLLLSQVDSYITFLIVYLGVISLAHAGGFMHAPMVLINTWFIRHRARAITISSAAFGMGGVLIAPILSVIVQTWGWRWGAALAGVLFLLIGIPLSLTIRRSPESMGLLPDGDEASARSRSTGAQVQGTPSARGASLPAAVHRRQAALDFTAPEAMRTLSYWLLVLATGLRNVVHAGIAFLMAPIVVWFLQGNGRSAEDSLPMAAFFVGFMSFGTVVLTPVLGWMGDRLSKPRLSAFCMAVGAVSIVILLNQSGRIWQLTLGVLLLAVAESTHHLDWAIMGDYFCRQAFATLRGWQHLPDQLMSMTTPVWMGWIFDRTGSYYWSLLPLALVYGLATCVYWFLPRPHTPVRLRVPVDAPAD